MQVAGSPCLLCRQQKSKRAIYSEPYSHIVPVLSGFVNEIFGITADLIILPSTATICRPCFRSVEKVIKLRQELEQKEKEILNGIKQAGEALGVQEHVRNM